MTDEEDGEAREGSQAGASQGGEDGSQEGSEDRKRPLNVQIPVYQHVQLHTLKVLTGKTMSQAVFEALESYFEELDEFDASSVPPLGQGEEGDDDD